MKHNHTDAQLQAAIDGACNKINEEHKDVGGLLILDPEDNRWRNEAPARLDLIKSALAALPEPEPPTVDWKATFEALESQWIVAERAVDNVLKILPELKKSPSWENAATLIREYIDLSNARAEKAEAELAETKAILQQVDLPDEPLVTKPISLPLAESMTLRDWLAGKALTMLADPDFSASPEDTAKLVYRIADAMLKAREVKP